MVTPSLWLWPRAAARLGIPVLETPPSGVDTTEAGGAATLDGIWVNSHEPNPVCAAVHELAHVLLGHCAFLGGPVTSDLFHAAEAEAELVALRVCQRIGQTDAQLNESVIYIAIMLRYAGSPLNSSEKLELVAKIILNAGLPA